MSIVEKLGIDKDYRGAVNGVDLERLQKQRDEMFEALIAIEANESLSMDAQLEIQTVCESATGKTWEEINALID